MDSHASSRALVIVPTYNEIENLTSGISRKIWQKIMILDNDLTAESDSVIVTSPAPITPSERNNVLESPKSDESVRRPISEPN